MAFLPRSKTAEEIFLTGDSVSVSAPHRVRTLSCVSTWRADLSGTLAGNESWGLELFCNYCVKLLNLLDEMRQEVIQKHGKNLKNPDLQMKSSCLTWWYLLATTSVI